MDWEQTIIGIVSFLFVAVLSVALERILNFVDYRNGGIAYSPLRLGKNKNKILGRYTTYLLNYIEIIIIAVSGSLLSVFIRDFIEGTFSLLIPLIILFVPTSLFIIIATAPDNKARKRLLPEGLEWLLIIIFYIVGIAWLWYKLTH